jgi:hypothetical protein
MPRIEIASGDERFTRIIIAGSKKEGLSIWIRTDVQATSYIVFRPTDKIQEVIDAITYVTNWEGNDG